MTTQGTAKQSIDLATAHLTVTTLLHTPYVRNSHQFASIVYYFEVHLCKRATIYHFLQAMALLVLSVLPLLLLPRVTVLALTPLLLLSLILVSPIPRLLLCSSMLPIRAVSLLFGLLLTVKGSASSVSIHSFFHSCCCSRCSATWVCSFSRFAFANDAFNAFDACLRGLDSSRLRYFPSFGLYPMPLRITFFSSLSATISSVSFK
mmetsp:Transcript_568/g.1000  ORF Transcript_568/g.1000 Transcript_568/m.1000 type:complete len:205 (-) Transcript_568:787-1401(-)